MAHTITTSYQDLLHAEPLDLLLALSVKLPSLWNQVARQREYEELGGVGYNPCQQARKEISHLIGQLKRMHAEIGELERHSHQWSEDDYCLICGADGRA